MRLPFEARAVSPSIIPPPGVDVIRFGGRATTPELRAGSRSTVPRIL
jgi:hypothetical protein